METIRVAELFAGVGGFRLALDGYNDDEHGWHLPAAGPYKTIWANQWSCPEPKRASLLRVAMRSALAKALWSTKTLSACSIRWRRASALSPITIWWWAASPARTIRLRDR